MKRLVSGLLVLVALITSGVVVTHYALRGDNAMMHGSGMMQGGGMMQGEGMMGRGGMGNMSMVRHRYVMHNGLDPAYANRSNPLEPTGDVLNSGERLYENNCASCHGPSGKGDGKAGETLDPEPTNIAAFSSMPMASDGYLYWTIVEGGKPLGTAMPAFRDRLEEDEIWQIIVYLREGL